MGGVLISVTYCSEIPLHMVQGCSVDQTESTQYHQGTTTKRHHFSDGCIEEPLSGSPPNPDTTVIVMQREPGLVAEENVCPLLTCPSYMASAKGKTSSLVCWGETLTDCWSTCIKSKLMKTSSNSLTTNDDTSCRSQPCPDAICRSGSRLQSPSMNEWVFPCISGSWST